MPEHHVGTPQQLSDLESFLWWDFVDIQTWQTWIVARGGNASTADVSFGTALGVQQALRGLQAANSGIEASSDADACINRAIVEHGIRPRVTSGGVMNLAPDQPGDLVGYVLGLALMAMTDGTWRRFKICRDQTCRASYFDATRNTGKTWCAMQSCGSRSKMRRFRSK